MAVQAMSMQSMQTPRLEADLELQAERAANVELQHQVEELAGRLSGTEADNRRLEDDLAMMQADFLVVS